MYTFQSTYRSFDLNYGKKVLHFHNYVLNTSDGGVAEYLRRHAERNPNDIWELVIPTVETSVEEDATPKPKRVGRPPKGVTTFRGERTSEVMEQKE